MIERTKFYLSKGFNVLTPDLRGTGKSEKQPISFGWNERLDILACVDSLKKKGFDTIAIHGHSLGAASILYTLNDFNQYYFVVLESPYDNIVNATKHRLNKFHISYFLFLPTVWITEFRLKIDIKNLYPENAIKKLDVPLLYFAGDKEQQIPINETYKIYNNCPSLSKEIHIFKGAKHGNFTDKYFNEYFSILDSFIVNK
ncbi:MAG: prolyl oligopeptidase family serine peptidase [Chitinophagales bacterium]